VLSALALVIGCSSSDNGAAGGSAGTGGDTAGSGGSAVSAGGSTVTAAGTGGAATGGNGGTSATAGSAGTGESAAGEQGSEAGAAGADGNTAGTGGTAGGASAGGSGGAAAGAGGTGAGGTSAGGSAGSGATGGTAGTAGSGGAAGGTSADPIGAIVTGSTLTAAIASNTFDITTMFTSWDTCPDNQVLVGFNYVGFKDFISGMQAVCGKLTVTKTTQLQVSVAAGATLLARGGNDPRSTGSVSCPANSVVIGFNGKVDDRIRSLSFVCAPVILEFQDGAQTIGLDLDNKVTLNAIAPMDQGNDIAFSGCPDGQIARGTQMMESEFGGPNGWLESFALACGTPSFTLPIGAPCTTSSDCDSRACDTTCKAFTCDAPTGCSCAPFGGKSYAFCPATTTSVEADAEGTCETKGMHLAWVTDQSTEGWLRFASNAAGVTDDAYIGVDDLTVHDTFALEPGAGALAFTDWGGGDYGLEPNCLNGTDCFGEVENCVTIRGDGAWNNVNCTGTHAFICSN
jgi:hypothetical protein